MRQLNGILLVDKPEGMRSRQLVDFVQHRFDQQKTGHGGTLDPIATGLMVILLGTGTKLNQFLVTGHKRYKATIRLGIETDTYDREGKVTAEAPVPQLTQADVRAALDRFTGKIDQQPPAYAAIKVHGVPAYKIARQGGEVDLAERAIEIHEIKILSFDGLDIDVDVRCSKGTYMRSLAHDVGAVLGCGAHLYNIRRLQSYPFDVTEAVPFSELEKMDFDVFVSRVMTISRALEHYPTVQAQGRLADVLRVGRPILGRDLEVFFRKGFKKGDWVVLSSPWRIAILEARIDSEGCRPEDFAASPLVYKRVINLDPQDAAHVA